MDYRNEPFGLPPKPRTQPHEWVVIGFVAGFAFLLALGVFAQP